MTPERCKELLPVMQAFAEGKEIESRFCTHQTKWHDCVTPTWAPEYNYRIKPQSVKTVGYRRYITDMGGGLYRVYCITSMHSPEYAEEGVDGFVRWIDTEWQYETVEP